MRILQQWEIGAIRMVILSLLVTLTEITMTTGSVTIEMEVSVQSTTHMCFRWFLGVPRDLLPLA